MTSKGERAIRRDALQRSCADCASPRRGTIACRRPGPRSTALPETRPFEFGDATRTSTRSPQSQRDRRSGADESTSARRTSRSTRPSTSPRARPCFIDVSHSMILYGEDRITPARSRARAHRLITLRYPKTVVRRAVRDDAKEVPLSDCPTSASGRITRTRRRGSAWRNRSSRAQGGEPADRDDTDGNRRASGGRAALQEPVRPRPKIVNKTLEEATSCRRRTSRSDVHGDRRPSLQQFVEKFTQLNRGRAYFATSRTWAFTC